MLLIFDIVVVVVRPLFMFNIKTLTCGTCVTRKLSINRNQIAVK